MLAPMPPSVGDPTATYDANGIGHIPVPCHLAVLYGELFQTKDEIKAGTRELLLGTPYLLAPGQWQVDGDPTVYKGDSVFYVNTAGSYTFNEAKQEVAP